MRPRTTRRQAPSAARRAISAALAVATLALLAALAGTGYAAIALPTHSVGTHQLRHRAVTNAKIVPGAGVSCSTPAPPAASPSAGRVGGGYAACPHGTYAIGGGVGTNDVAGVTVTESLPYNSAAHSYSGAADAWSVHVQNAAAHAQAIEVYAVCITAARAAATY